MANSCFNSVTFKGSNQNLSNLKVLFDKLIKQEAKSKNGQIPPFAETSKGYMFGIEFNNVTASFETKGWPNTELLIAIADHFELDFESSYDELGMEIYGQANYYDGRLAIVELDETDFAKFRYDDDNDVYIYRRKEYDCEIEILEILLDRKIKNARKKKLKNNTPKTLAASGYQPKPYHNSHKVVAMNIQT